MHGFEFVRATQRPHGQSFTGSNHPSAGAFSPRRFPTWPNLDWARQSSGSNRFDDPRGVQDEFTTLYGTEAIEACYAETLDRFRPGHSWLAKALTGIPSMAPDDVDNFDSEPGPKLVGPGRVPIEFFARRRMVTFVATSRRMFLDVRIEATETAEALPRTQKWRSCFVGFCDLGLKPGDFTSNGRSLTQAIALWAFRHDFDGLVSTSSHDLRHAWTCWAIFPRAEIREASPAREIALDDPALRSIAQRFNLTID